MLRAIPVLLSLFLVVSSAAASCPEPRPVRHASFEGAFDFTASNYEGVTALCTGVNPLVIMQDLEDSSIWYPWWPVAACDEWLVNARLDLGRAGAHDGQ